MEGHFTCEFHVSSMDSEEAHFTSGFWKDMYQVGKEKTQYRYRWTWFDAYRSMNIMMNESRETIWQNRCCNVKG